MRAMNIAFDAFVLISKSRSQPWTNLHETCKVNNRTNW